MSERLQRSLLAIPATSEQLLPKAARSAADSIFIDLEDAVAPRQKEVARAHAISALQGLDWSNKLVAVRVNDLRSPWGYKDIIEVAESCARLDAILLPKTNDSSDIHFLDTLLSGIEARCLRGRRIHIDALIETPLGVANVEAIAAASPRLQSLSFGVGDYSVAMHAPQTNFGVPDPDYGILTGRSGSESREFHWNDQWHFAMARICNACRANGLRPIDGPFTDIADLAGYRAAVCRARAQGFEGKWAIHPSQLSIANECFAPARQEIDWARRVSQAMQSAIDAGRGAAQLDGRMIDLAHLRQAEHLLARQAMIDALPR